MSIQERRGAVCRCNCGQHLGLCFALWVLGEISRHFIDFLVVTAMTSPTFKKTVILIY